ncbi:hypothetical protein MAR_011003 [Mya arenaria]|uniref:Uncharacterized protein n=1 Tax=Mya arenaria TaxID=6604 RepID=A0ABY7FVV8_MYAAR|nr:hypothetical protein MAR_011003 [Mya arenaria]
MKMLEGRWICCVALLPLDLQAVSVATAKPVPERWNGANIFIKLCRIELPEGVDLGEVFCLPSRQGEVFLRQLVPHGQKMFYFLTIIAYKGLCSKVSCRKAGVAWNKISSSCVFRSDQHTGLDVAHIRVHNALNTGIKYLHKWAYSKEIFN